MGHSIFTEKIRALRKKAGYTQEEVSAKLNIQRQTYCNYENESRNPPIEIIVALADLYHVSVDFLVRENVPADFAPLDTYQMEFNNGFSTLNDDRKENVLQFIRFQHFLSE